MKNNRYARLIDYLTKGNEETKINNLFNQSGFQLSIVQYQIARYIFFITWLILTNVIYQLKGGNYPTKQIFFIIIILLITTPTTNFLGKKTPFQLVINLFIHNNKRRKNIEIYRSISQLKNIVIAKKNNPPSSDLILEQLRKFSKYTRPNYNRMIALWSIGKKDEACDYLEKSIDTREAMELANIIRKLDDLNPYELLTQINLVQEIIKKERETKKLKSNENKSNFVYLIVILSSVAIMVNFVIVVYYLETINQLKYLN